MVTIYPADGLDRYRSKSWAVEILDGDAWRPAYPLARTNKSINYWHQGQDATVSFLTFATTGEVRVRITRLKGDIGTLEISPLNRKVQAAVEGDTAEFAMNPLDKFWVIADGEDADSLVLFADPPVEPPGKDDLYFGPGVHNIGRGYQPDNGQTVYIDGGAWVLGSFDIRDRNNVTFAGHGVLSGELWTSQGLLGFRMDFTEAQDYIMIRGYYGRGASGNALTNLTIVDAPFYFTFGGLSTIRGVKLLSPWYWSNDGFSVSPDVLTDEATIRDCFAFTDDDTFFPRQSSLGNITVTNCFVGTTGNGVFNMAYWPDRLDHDFRYVVRDLDIRVPIGNNPHAIFQMVLDGKAGQGGMGTKNQFFEDIRIEGNPAGGLIDIRNRPYPWGGDPDSPTTGNSYNIRFRNLFLFGTPGKKSVILGRDAENGHHDYVFEHVVIGGMTLTDDNFDDFIETNEFTSGFRVIASSGAG